MAGWQIGGPPLPRLPLRKNAARRGPCGSCWQFPTTAVGKRQDQAVALAMTYPPGDRAWGTIDTQGWPARHERPLQSESRMQEIGPFGSMSGDGKRARWHSLTAPRPTDPNRKFASLFALVLAP
jgi:hypothetical protein